MKSVISALPVWSEEDQSPSDGTLLKKPDHCSKVKAKYCRKHYQRIKSVKGFHTCPGGLSSYSTGDEEREIVTAIRIAGFYDNSKIKNSNDYLPTLPTALVLESVAKTNDLRKDIILNRRDDTPSKSTSEDSNLENKELVDFSLHEVRKFNREIKRLSEEINKSEGKLDIKEIDQKVKTIFASSCLISVRLDAYDFEANPGIIKSKDMYPATVFKKFDKACKILQVYAKDESVRIPKFRGTSHKTISAYPVFDFLPFVLIENAIKYSPKQQEVNLEFIESGNHLSLKVSSMGPCCSKEELPLLLDKKFRGKNATITESSGGGYGLYFAKMICDLHFVGIKVNSGQPVTTLNGVQYSEFVVELTFPE